MSFWLIRNFKVFIIKNLRADSSNSDKETRSLPNADLGLGPKNSNLDTAGVHF